VCVVVSSPECLIRRKRKKERVENRKQLKKVAKSDSQLTPFYHQNDDKAKQFSIVIFSFDGTERRKSHIEATRHVIKSSDLENSKE
jgi:hypothetical protein